MGRNGAELDDLVQEGLIDVWLCLQKGAIPSAENIANRMKTYVKWLGRQLPAPYEELLSFDSLADEELEL